ncbi:ABC transporter substrate-binding protein [Robertkochia flava]|uniref:ABC transporter substrate-binding protein n=1 Tax=Robertkochia flava TaxID=3447986 RepID=UPI001CCFAF46|nr:ABC transporter substrate-binding protein [Robertkochia marina]
MRPRIGVYYFRILFFICGLSFVTGCRETPSQSSPSTPTGTATGFSIHKVSPNLTEVVVHTPWPDARTPFRYAFLDREAAARTTLDRDAYDAIILTPVASIIATSTTHIPALEALGELNTLKGFPDTRYISSPKARTMIAKGHIKDVGVNEAMNTESVLELHPELIIGFSINDQNASYDVLERAGIPIVYNGDWVERHPLGKAEWIRFFGVLFQKEELADSIYHQIAGAYESARSLASKAGSRPTVLSGAMYRDVWYLPAGESWAAQFIKDANGEYLWNDTRGTGSLSLSFESVLAKAAEADIWLGAAQFTAYDQLLGSNKHYQKFKAFNERKIFTISKTTGEEGGVLFYELAPNRPDIVLKDMIHILHPELLPDHDPVFYKPLDPFEK